MKTVFLSAVLFCVSIGLQTLLKNTEHVKCGCDCRLDGRARGPWLMGTASLRPTFAFNPPPRLYMEPIISFLPLILPKDHFTLYKRRFSSQTELELFFSAVVFI